MTTVNLVENQAKISIDTHDTTLQRRYTNRKATRIAEDGRMVVSCDESRGTAHVRVKQ